MVNFVLCDFAFFCFFYSFFLAFFYVSGRLFDNFILKRRDLPVKFSTAVIKFNLEDFQICSNTNVNGDGDNLIVIWVKIKNPNNSRFAWFDIGAAVLHTGVQCRRQWGPQPQVPRFVLQKPNTEAGEAGETSLVGKQIKLTYIGKRLLKLCICFSYLTYKTKNTNN